MKNKVISIGIVCLFMTGFFIGFLNLGSDWAKGTDVSGIVFDGSGGPWTLAGSPYIVVGDVIVPGGATLTIEPGVEVRFDGFYGIYVSGTLMAVGTETNRINISSNMITPAPMDWNTIQISFIGYAEVKYCDITYGFNSIFLDSSSNNMIINNTISNNRNGINIYSSNNNTLINNTVSNNGDGILLDRSSDINITNNNFVNNGIYILGDQLSHYNTHIIPDNKVNGKPLYYYKDRSVINIDNLPVGELILANCTDIDVKNIQINNTDMGIMAAYSTNITITNCDILSNNRIGIDFISSGGLIEYNNITSNGNGIRCESSSPTIIHNYITSNSGEGLALFVSQSKVSNNYLSDNGWGIRIDLSNPYTANNTLVNNGGGIYFNNPIGGVSINNTIKDNTGRGIWLSGGAAPTIVNCTIENNQYAFFIVGSHPTTINTTFDDTKVWLDSFSTLTVKNYLHVLVLDATTNPLQGTDVNITDNGNPVYQTPGFGGSDPQTGSDGFVRWIVVTDKIYIGSNTATENITTAEVSYPLKTFIDNPRDVNMFTSHTEVFIEVGGTYLPDLMLTKVDISFNPPSPVKDKTIMIIGAKIHNIGLKEGRNIVVRFYKGVPPTNLIGEDLVLSIPGLGGTDWAEVQWNATTIGTHKIYVVVDPDDWIVESDEKNNMANKTIDVGVPLYEGWNLISIPYIQADTNLAYVLSSITGSYNAVQWYNATDSNDQWKHNCTSKPSALNDLDDIDHVIGFWIHIIQSGETIFIFNGTQLTENQSITLYPGWNMIGYPSLTSYNRTEGLNNINFSQDVDSIWTYQTTTKKWEEIKETDHFEPGKGYWVHALFEKTWEIPL